MISTSLILFESLLLWGSRVRVFQDDSTLHTKTGAFEPEVISALRQAGAIVRTGHFNRFAHDKVMI
jgi:hypothetical protein